MRVWSFKNGLDFLDAGERVRRFHERWLNRVLASPEAEFLRIPVRRVDDGGFSALVNSPGGRERAEQWWFDAFAQMDAIE